MERIFPVEIGLLNCQRVALNVGMSQCTVTMHEPLFPLFLEPRYLRKPSAYTENKIVRHAMDALDNRLDDPGQCTIRIRPIPMHKCQHTPSARRVSVPNCSARES